MDFEHYEAEDLVLEDSFRNYCLGTNKADAVFWEDWVVRHPDRGAVVRDAKELFFILNGNITAEQFKRDQSRFAFTFSEHINGHEVTDRKRSPLRRILLYTGSAAASLLLFVFVAKYFVRQESKPAVRPAFSQVHKSEAGERKSFQLPDGTTVMLNSGSTIKVDDNFNATTRKLTLKGEAYFDVAANEQLPFIIHTSLMDISVLGTAFNVRAYDGENTVETALIRGAVQVTLLMDGNRRVLLRPNEKIVASAGHADGYAVKEMEPEKRDSMPAEISWTKNRLVFTNNSFGEIATALERWYGVHLIFENEAVKQYRFTATFDQKNITQVLEALKLSRYFTYRIDESNKIRILN